MFASGQKLLSDAKMTNHLNHIISCKTCFKTNEKVKVKNIMRLRIIRSQW